MSLFAIGDTHLSLGADKPMDIFKGWSDYVGRLEKNWRRVVEDDDTVVVAGDISWAMKLEDTYEDFKFLNSLPGQKIILKGNHDYWWTTRKKMEGFFEASGFDSIRILHNNAYLAGSVAVCGTRGWFFDCAEEEDEKVLNREVGRLKTSIDAARALGAEPVVFMHYPPISREQTCGELYDLLVRENIRRCYYGHLHDASCKWAFIGVSDGIDFSLISGDYLEFCPKLIEKY